MTLSATIRLQNNPAYPPGSASVFLLPSFKSTTVTFTFSEAIDPTSFALSDIEWAGTACATFSNLQQVNATTWTATLTAMDNLQGAHASFGLSLDKVKYANGQAGPGNVYVGATRPNGSGLGVYVDTVRPTLESITIADTELSVDETTTVTFAFNESVRGFNKDDIVLPDNCTLVGDVYQVNPSLYTATLRANGDGHRVTNSVIRVRMDGLRDDYDTPGVGLSAPSSPVHTTGSRPVLNDAPRNVTVDRSQMVLRFNQILDAQHKPDKSNFRVRLGDGTDSAVTNVAVDGSNVTLTLATAAKSDSLNATVSYTDPTENSDDINALQSAAHGSDVASFTGRSVLNITQADNTPPKISSVTVDGRVVVITYTDENSLNPNRVPPLGYYELLINRPDKIGNERHNFTSVTMDARAKTVTLTMPLEMPDPASEVSAYLSFKGDPVIEDEAGNRERPGLNWTMINLTDHTAPVLIANGANAPQVNGRQLTLSYSDARNLGSAVPAGTAFAVRANGELIPVTEVAVNGKNVILTLATAVVHRQTVTVSYTDPSNQNDRNAIQDVSGNDAASFTDKSVTNNTPDITAPVLSAASISNNLLTLDYAETSQMGSGAVSATAFRVLVNGSAVAVTNVDMSAAASSNRVTLTLAHPVAGDDSVVLAYTRPAIGVGIQDTRGNVSDSFLPRAVTNRSDATLPVLVTTGDGAPRVNGNHLWLDYADINDLGPDVPAVTAFTVRANGTVVPVTAVAVTGKTVMLTLATAVVHRQEVTVSYADPTTGNDPNAIQDTVGNDAASFTTQLVRNDTLKLAPPVLVTEGPNAPKISANKLVLTYTDEGDLATGAAAPLPAAFTVTVDGVANAVTEVAVAGKTVTLTLTRPVTTSEQRVTVSYTDPSSHNDVRAIQDAGGNDAASFVNQPVVNTTPASQRPSETQIENDHTPPVLNTATVDGTRLVLTYTDEGYLQSRNNKPLAEDFSVKVNGVDVPNAVADVAVNSAARTVTLTLARGVAQGAVVTLSYTNETRGGAGSDHIRDEAGNYAASFQDRSVNNLTDSTPPELIITGPGAPWVDGDRLVLSYTGLDNLSVTGPRPTAFTVSTGDAAIAVTGVLVNAAGKTVTLTLAAPVAHGQVVSISYADPTTGDDADAIQDTIGNDAASFTVPVVRNNTPADATAPVLASAEVDGNQLVLTYTEVNSLHDTNKPAPTAFTVQVNGQPTAVTNVAVNAEAKTVTLTLPTAVTAAQTVSVSYTDPSANDDTAAIQDATGNDAASFTILSVTNITTPPTLVTDAPNGPKVIGNQLTLNYNDTSNLGTGTATPPTTAFAVLAGGVAVAVTGVNVAGKTVTLTLATPVIHRQTVSVSYTDPSANDDTAAIQDAAGNDAASFTGQTVLNDTPDITPPALITTGPNVPKVTGNQLTLTYNDDNNLGAGAAAPPATAFAVLVDGVAVVVTGVNVAGKTVTLTLAAAVTPEQRVSVSYTDPSPTENDRSAIQDEAGNDAASFTGQAVLNDTTPPALVTTGPDAPKVNGSQLTLTYNDDNNLGTGAAAPPATAFTVLVNGVAVAVTTVFVAGKTVTLTLAAAVTREQSVFVSYTDPSANNDPAAIQDVVGNDAASFTGQAVLNDTPLPTPPVLVLTGAQAPRVNGNQLTLNYNDDSNLSAAGPANTAFTVRVGDVVNAVTRTAVDPVAKTVTLTLTTPVTHEQSVFVSYTDPSANDDEAAIQDAAGSDAASFTGQAVLNNTPDTTPPVLLTTGDNAPKVIGNLLTLHFTDNSDLGAEAAAPPATAFAVLVDGTAVAVSSVAVLDKAVTLTLAATVTPGQLVTVSYTDPSVNDDTAAIQDAAGNDAASFTPQTVLTPDTTPPVLVTTAPNAPKVIGNLLTLTYADNSDLRAGAAAPLPAAFAVLANGNAVAVSSVAVADKVVTLTLAAAVAPGQTVTVSYTDPSAANDEVAIQDVAGNDAASFTTQAVLNNTPDTTPDTTPPTLVTTAPNAPRVIGDRLTLHFADNSDLGTGDAAPFATAFAVRVDGNAVAVTGVSVVGKAVTLTLATAPAPGQTVTVSYTDPTPDLDDSNAIQDAVGNDAASFTGQAVLNETPDTTPPVLVITGDSAPRVIGDRLTLNYNDTSNLGTGDAAPLPAAFAVLVNGTAVAVTAVDVAGKAVTLTLATAVTPGQTVTVSYTDPTPDLDDSNAIQDAAGNDAVSFAPQTVSSAPDTTPPTLVTTAPNAPKVVGNQLTLTYADDNNLGAGTAAPPTTAFVVRVDGTAVAVTTVDVAGKTVTLTLAAAVTPGQQVLVSYTDPSANDDPAAIQDAAGNDAASVTGQSVRNDSPPDNTPPLLVTEGADAPTVNGRQLVLHYTDDNILGSAGPGADAFMVRVGETPIRVTNVVPNPVAKTVTLTLATAVTPGQEVFVSYTDPTTNNDINAIQDAAGNDAISFTGQRVTNAAQTDIAPPVLVTEGEDAPKINGNRLVLTYLDANNLGSGANAPLPGAFTVRIDGVVNIVTGVNVTGKTVTLTLTNTVTASQSVNVSYADPSAGDDLQAVQDAAGNDAASFTNLPVNNATRADTEPPVLITTGDKAPKVTGNQLVLTYNDANNLGGVGPAATAFVVRVDATVNRVTNAVVDPAAKTVTLTLADAVTPDQIVSVSYTDPSTNNDIDAIQDAAGNDAASFTGEPVDNVEDTTAPVFGGATVVGDFLVLTFTEETMLNYGGMPAAAAFSVHVNGSTVVAVTRVEFTAGNNQVVLTLASPVTEGDRVTLDYTRPASGSVIQDIAGNAAESFAGRPVDNWTDATPPVLVTEGANGPKVDGNQLVLHYTDAHNLSRTGPANTAFEVRVGEAANAVTNVVTSTVVDPVAKTVTLTLTNAVTPGQRVSVSYTDPSVNNDANAIQDISGNDAASFTNQPVVHAPQADTAPPVLLTSGTNGPKVNGNQLVLTYDDATDLASGARAPLPGAFTVQVNGATTNSVTGVNITGKTVTLTLATAVTAGQVVRVSYTDPTADNDTEAVQDAAGNDAVSITSQLVENITVATTDTAPPVLVTTGPDAPKVDGRQLVLHYTDANDLGGAGPGTEAFVVRVGETTIRVANVVPNPVTKTVTLTLATAVTAGQRVSVSYTDPTGGDDTDAIQDAAGNDAISFTNQPVENITVAPTDTAPPVLVTTGPGTPKVNGNQLVLTYADANNLGSVGPANTAFTVRVGETLNSVTSAVVNPVAKTVTLTLATAVTPGQRVFVSYTDPTADNDTEAVQDAAGNDAVSFADQPVENITVAPTDTAPPVLITSGANAPKVNGNQLVLTYEDINNLGSVGPANTAFTVRVGETLNSVTSAVVNPVTKTVTLTLATAVTAGQRVSVSYTDPTADNDTEAVQDAAGNDAVSFADQPVENITVAPTDTAPPVLITSGANAPKVNGNQLVLTYEDINNLGSVGPANTAFTVRVGETLNSVTSAVVNPVTKTVTLTLTTAVTAGQVVRVSYTDPTGDNDTEAVQDAAGNDAISFTNEPVENITVAPTDTAPPVLVTTGPGTPKVNGNQLVLTYEDINNLGSVGPANTAFTVRVGETLNSVTSAVVNPVTKTVTLTLATAVTAGQRVSVSYTDPTADNDTEAVQDAAGNDAVSFTNEPVENITAAPPPTTPTTEPSTTPTQTPTQALTPTSTSGASSSGTSTASGSRAFDDNDCVPTAQEDQIPGLARPGGAAPMAGDGNGDGIKDSLQSAVASLNGVTLVVTDQNGKPLVETADVRISVMEQKAAPVHLPSGFEMPIGMLDFKVEPLVTAGSIESFSLYVDPTRNINGYWVQDFTGAWVNLASEPYGGQVVTEGNRLRLDFKITDGGRFDADGKADGSIAVSGAAAHMPQLSIMGQAPDFAHGGVFWF